MNKNNNRGFLSRGALIGLAVMAIFAGVMVMFLAGWKTIEGNQIGVKETMNGGVDPNPMPPKMYFFNRFTTTVFPYDISGQVFNMNSHAPKNNTTEGWDMDDLEVKSSDNQKVLVRSKTRWRLDPTKIISIHKAYRDDIEDRLLKAEVIRVLGSKATVLPAISLYSGISQNTARAEIEAELKSPTGDLARNGVVVDSFVFEKVEFPNKDYVDNIEARQLAIIRESRANEDTKANLAEAKAAEAKAQKEAKVAVVAAEASKSVALLNQQAISEQAIIKIKADAENAITTQKAESEKIVLAAKADAEKVFVNAKAEADRNVVISEAQKQAEINRAKGIEAVGAAEAQAKKLQLTAFSVPGSDLYARVEVARSMSTMLTGVKGWLPQGVNYNTVARDFEGSVSLLMGQQQSAPVTAK